MAISSLLLSLLPLATEFLKLWNSKEARKYLDEMIEIKEDLLKEKSKGADADDQKIVHLRSRLQIVSEAAFAEWRAQNKPS